MNGDNREALVADLVTASFNVRLVEEPEYDLEEVFLRFTSTRSPQPQEEQDEHTDEVAPTEEINQ